MNELSNLLAPENQGRINESFLKAHQLKSMSFSTTWHWMRLRDDAQRKSFYVDVHESGDGGKSTDILRDPSH